MNHRFRIAVVILLGNAGVLLCQDNPHGNISVPCNTCHSTESWKVELASTRFDHAKTRFALSGQHLTVPCRQCHATLKFSEAPVRCASCHDDIHRGELGLACDRCHTPQSWLIADMPRRHAQTRFPLTGMHLNASCEQCHVQQQKHQYVGLSIECYSCHKKDYQATVAPAHVASGISTECASCHSVQATTWGGSFDHAQTGFILAGAHAQASCGDCHTANRFRETPRECYSCHQSNYAATRNPPHVAAGFGTTCGQCHSASTSTWGGSFNHAQTGFALNGVHGATTCVSCHAGGRFKGTPTDCYGCHQGDFTATTNPAHVAAGFPTACVNCHSASAASWSSTFAHAQTGFALTGAHATATCASCHAGNRFKGTPTDCYACHQQDYTGATNPVHSPGSFPTACVTCHSTSAWRPSTFNHSTYFPISAGSRHAPGRWNACSDCHTSPTNFAVFSCLNCHEHNQTSMDSKHSGRNGYKYESQACYNCHPRGNGG